MSTRNEQIWVEPGEEQAGKQSKAVPTRVPIERALRQLLDGQLRLSKLQGGPLISLLDALSDQAKAVDCIGPKLQSNSAEALVNQKILRSGLRQDFVECRTLQWVHGARKLRSLAENGWVSIVSRRATLLDDLRFQYSQMVSKLQQVPVLELPPREQMDKEGIVEVQYDHVARPHFLICRLPPDWYVFHQRLGSLRKDVEAAISVGLSEARILAIEERGAAPLQLSPLRNIASHPAGTTWYLLTRDLPDVWFREKPDRGQAKREASAWLIRAGKECQARQKCMSRTDGMEVMSERFGLSQTTAERLWKIVDHVSKGRSGRIPSSQQISLKEIREINWMVGFF